MSILNKDYIVVFSDGSKWAIPISVIAEHHAVHNSEDGNINKTLSEKTTHLFSSNHDAISDWAVNNMNWSDVKAYARCVCYPNLDWEKEWSNSSFEID